MSRKKSLSSVLDEESSSRVYATPSRIRRNRSTSNIFGEESLNQSSALGRLVACNCSECNGKLVDPRTKIIHEINQSSDDDDEAEIDNTETDVDFDNISSEPRRVEADSDDTSSEPLRVGELE